MRCFVALPVAPPVRTRLRAVQDELRRARADVSWVSEENFHLTLKFLGEIDEAAAEALRGLLGPEIARRSSPRLAYAGLGTFPERGTPRVVWAGAGGDAAAVSDLAAAVERAAETLGVPPERRPFTAHLTLGRVRSPRGQAALRAAIARHAGAEFGADAPAAAVLYRSTLTPSGPLYEPLAEFPFSASGMAP
jgi:2'-5' RNA ligase